MGSAKIIEDKGELNRTKYVIHLIPVEVLKAKVTIDKLLSRIDYCWYTYTSGRIEAGWCDYKLQSNISEMHTIRAVIKNAKVGAGILLPWWR